MRRFGTWLLVEPGELDPYLAARLGGEPLADTFTTKQLRERLSGRRAPVKAALLDQRTLAGMGNIYVDEALWRARIHPLIQMMVHEFGQALADPRAARPVGNLGG